MRSKLSILTILVFLACHALAALPGRANFCLNGSGGHNQDTDGDGFDDCEDNCPLQSNDQADADGDGIGDLCDCGITVPVGDGNALRVAITVAPADCAIAVPAGTYGLNSDLLFNDGLSLLGAGAGSTIIDRNGGVGSEVVLIQQQSGNIFIGGMTLTGAWRGVTASSTFVGSVTLSDVIISDNSGGGGILIQGGSTFDLRGGAVVDLNNSVVRDNSTSDDGGGIRIKDGDGASGGRLRARHSSIALNQAVGSGGGVFVVGSINGSTQSGQAELTRCTIDGNHSEEQGGGLATALPAVVTIQDSTIADNTANGDGGGIYNDGSGVSGGSVVTLTGTTVSGNTSNRNGGGIYNGGSVFPPGRGIFGAELGLSNVTISGNSAVLNGGGLFNGGAADAMNLGGNLGCQNCTITDNLASAGGGVAVEAVNPGQAELGNSVIAGNFAVSGLDCHGELLSAGYNLVEDPAGCTFNGDATGTVLGVDPQLGPLADNGGPTLTHRPGPRLVNQANPLPPWDDGLPRCPLTDQRVFVRPEGGGCDIGAVEQECPPDGTDSDGDGVPDACDCAPLNPMIRPPAVVTSVAMEKLPAFGARLSWMPAVGTDGGYAITRGLLSELNVRDYGNCLEVGWLMTEYDDPESLPPGSGFTYLVQGLSLDCGPGTLGYRSDGVERFNQRLLACP